MSSPLSTPPVSTPPPSTPASFHTAEERSSRTPIRKSPEAAGTTTSPQHQSAPRRLALPIPFELCQHVHIFFEESLYNHALQLLKQLLISGKTTTLTPRRRASFIPPPSHLDLISTFVIHPRHTTRASSRGNHDAATLALDYLRSLLATVGAVDAGFGQAFRFPAARALDMWRGESGIKRKAGVALDEDNGESEDETKIRHPLAQEGVWATARDFWHIVGWALNCAVKHRKRWEYWQVWLEFMVSVMEADVRERIALRDSGEKSRPLQASILGRFLLLCERGEGRQVWKRAVAAIFADGLEASMKRFPEVWKDETRMRRKDADEAKIKEMPKVNIEEDVYGDYFGHDESSDGLSDSATNVDSIVINTGLGLNSTDEITNWLKFGGPRARALRLRLIALIILVCNETHNSSFISLFELFDLLATEVTSLPFDHFTHLLHIQALDLLTPESLSSLTQIIISRLIDHSAPRNPDPSDAFDQDTLATCFLPFAANTSSPEDNAKLSWAVESLFRLYYLTQVGMKLSPALSAAVETGIAAREKRARVDGRKKAGTKKARDEEGFRERMGESAERMRMMLGLLEAKQEKAEKEKERRKVAKKESRRRAKESKKAGGGGGGEEKEALERFWESQKADGLDGGGDI